MEMSQNSILTCTKYLIRKPCNLNNSHFIKMELPLIEYKMVIILNYYNKKYPNNGGSKNKMN